MTVSKFEVGVSNGKLNEPPKSCIPSKANMKMNRKSKNNKDMMEDKAFIRAITRFLRGDQYLEQILQRNHPKQASSKLHFTG